MVTKQFPRVLKGVEIDVISLGLVQSKLTEITLITISNNIVF